MRSVLKGYRPDRPAADCDNDGVCAVSADYFSNCTRTMVQRGAGDSTETWSCSTSYGDAQEARLASVGDANGSIWRYAYNAAGKLTTVTAPLPAGNRAFRYDARQFLDTETTAESGLVHFDRNAIGQMTGRTDARGVLATYQYVDPLSRLTNVSWQTADDVTRTYEASNLKRVSSPASGTLDYTYDEINRVTSATWVYRGVTYASGYGYDETGCLRTITYPTGTVVTQTCDGLNRVKSISIQRPGGSTEAVVHADLTYHASGQPLHYTFGNGVTTDVTYDDHARLSTLTSSVSGQSVAGLTYGYDGAGNVVSFNNTAQPGAARTMGYDRLDRLWWTFASQQWGFTSYTYDVLGNITEKSTQSGTTTYGYDPATNRLAYSQGPGPTTVGLSWDAPGRLAASSDQATYRYDPAGRRIEKIEAFGSTVYHYDVAGRVIAETRPDGTKVRDYIYLGNKLVAVDGCVTSDGGLCIERHWYHTDALGSVLARTDLTGTIVAQFDYEPWGVRWNAAGLVAGVDGDRQYNGRVYDQGTGFHDYGARLYWPEIGRLISADTYAGDIGNPASLNRYSYVWNNPYKYTDPTGHTVDKSDDKDGNYEKAREHLSKDSGMKKVFEKAEGSKYTYKLKINKNKHDAYDAETRTIHWDPSAGLELESGEIQSAALGLGHEMAHIMEMEELTFFQQLFISGPLARTDEEVIAIEAAAAKTLGEPVRTKYEQGIRAVRMNSLTATRKRKP